MRILPYGKLYCNPRPRAKSPETWHLLRTLWVPSSKRAGHCSKPCPQYILRHWIHWNQSYSSTTPKHASPLLRRLPHSSIRIFKNGKFVGTASTDLLAFLPPSSKPLNQVGASQDDDNMLGYFPAISLFHGGALEVNIGPCFWFPPSGSPENVGRGPDRIFSQ